MRRDKEGDEMRDFATERQKERDRKHRKAGRKYEETRGWQKRNDENGDW